MKKCLYILLVSLNIYSLTAQNCTLPKDGKYIVEYDSEFRNRPKYNFEIVGDHYYAYENGQKKEYKIVKLNDCSFRFQNEEIIDETKLTELQKMLNKQKPYFDIYKVEKNIYYFVCRIDLHIQSYSGKFIREENK
jgi:hypothetical protein